MIRRFLSIAVLLVAGVVLAEADPHVSLKEKEKDFGSMRAGDPLVHSFELKNVGTTDLQVIKLLTS